ncbi:MAG TPA: cytochrome P450, partial [Acidimicrobiales bacterium]|nr:cytochrome P450 [Acidimicrobiales bacterium]
LRETGPVHSGGVFQLVGHPVDSSLGRPDEPTFSCFSWDTVDRALRDSSTFSSSASEGAGLIFGRNILQMDGDEHRRYRSIVQPVFTRNSTKWWTDRWISDSVDLLVRRFEDRGRAELSIEFCALLPLLITTGSFGVGGEDVLSYRELVERMIRPTRDLTDKQAAAETVAAQLTPMIEARRGCPADDFLSVLANGRLTDGEGTRPLTDDEILGYSRLLLAAGTGTTWRQLAITLFALLSDPEQLAAVQADPSLLRFAIEESVRWEVTDPVFRRRVTRDIAFGGVDVPAGSMLEMCLGAANRDPTRWSDPHRYDLRRPLLPHAGFGGGAHVCLGVHLARVELTTAVASLLERLPGIRLDPDADTPRIVGLEHRGVTSLPVVFG